MRGDDLIRAYKERFGDKTLLAFSRGKDAIGTALAIRDKLDVIPVHYTTVPGLEFIEEGLAYYEKHLFGRHIYRMPHPSFYRMIGSDFLYQDINNAQVFAAANLPVLKHTDVSRMVLNMEGAPLDTMNAIGVRAADSPMRRTAMNKYGPIRGSTRNWYPVWDWDKARLVSEIQRSGISLPIDYWLWGRSFDGVDVRFMLPMKKHLPRDYAKVLEWFPLLEADIRRYEMHLRGADEAKHANHDEADDEADGADIGDDEAE